MSSGIHNAARLDPLVPDVLRAYTAKRERLKEYTLGQPDRATIIIDEVQKAPELLSVVHSIMELKRGYKFILTGSSSRKLRQTGGGWICSLGEFFFEQCILSWQAGWGKTF